MTKSYKGLARGNLCKSGACSFLTDGSRASATSSILCIWSEAAKGEMAICGIGFSGFVRACVIEKLAKKGACA